MIPAWFLLPGHKSGLVESSYPNYGEQKWIGNGLRYSQLLWYQSLVLFDFWSSLAGEQRK